MDTEVEALPVRRVSARVVALVVGVAVLGLFTLLAFARPPAPDDASALLGGRAPAIQGETIGGGQYDLDDHRGSWVLVNFFATWCAGCVNEHPELVELEAWGQTEGNLDLVAVVFNDDPEQVEEFFATRGGGWPVLNNPEVPFDYRVAQIPETFLVSPAGQIVLHIEGEVAASEIVRLIESGSGS